MPFTRCYGCNEIVPIEEVGMCIQNRRERAMANVYENEPDRRQMEEGQKPIVVSRFRPRYRQLSESEITLHDDIKAQAQALEHLFSELNDGRYKSLAMTALEQAVMWAIKELTS